METETATSTREKIRNILEGRSIIIPRRLASQLRDHSQKQSGREITALTYKFISLTYAARQEKNRAKGQRTKSVAIHTDRFLPAISASPTTINRAKRWLEKQRWLEIDHGFSPGKSSKKYRPRYSKNTVEFHTKKKRKFPFGKPHCTRHQFN
jgi:hypothetical protein